MLFLLEDLLHILTPPLIHFGEII